MFTPWRCFQVLADHQSISDKMTLGISYGKLPTTLLAKSSFWVLPASSKITNRFPCLWVLAAFISLVDHLLFLTVSTYSNPFSVFHCFNVTVLVLLALMKSIILRAMSNHPELKEHSGMMLLLSFSLAIMLMWRPNLLKFLGKKNSKTCSWDFHLLTTLPLV